MFYKRTCHQKDCIKKIDLHVHTTASDGKYSTKEIIELANVYNISYLAITDHDTVYGIPQEKIYGHTEIIPGIEFSTTLDDREIHILGYYIDINNPGILTEIENLKYARENRMEKIVEKINEIGIDITSKEVRDIAKGGNIGRPHIGLLLVKKGIVNSLDEAFEKYLDKGKPGFVPRYKLSPFAAIKLIKEAKGVAILAHPGLGFPENEFHDMIKCGLCGIEVYHPAHDDKTIDLYLKLAKKHKLIVTGGSDFHGYNDEDWSNLGNTNISEKTIIQLKKISGQYCEI